MDSHLLGPIVKSDGYRIYRKPGVMSGKKVIDPKTGVSTQKYKYGDYEVGVTTDGVIDHRFFRPSR